MNLKEIVRDIPDFPKQGILFRDITPLLSHPEAFRATINRFLGCFAELTVEKVIGIESRGFLFGPILAYQLGAGFVPVRKPGKLPSKVLSESYELEYGEDSIEMHTDGVEKGDRVLIVDDLIATGGTALAAANLVERAGGRVVGLGFVIELSALAGRERLSEYEVTSLLKY